MKKRIPKFDKVEIPPNMPLFIISTASELLGIHPRTIRLYEKNNLVIPKRKNGHRLYSINDLSWIKCIRKMLHEDKLSVNGIKKLLEITPCWKIRNCPPSIKNKCPVKKSPNNKCWEINTLCNKKKKECKTCPIFISKK